MSILIRHTVKWVATDRQSRSHATPHRGPCYAAIFPPETIPPPMSPARWLNSAAQKPSFARSPNDTSLQSIVASISESSRPPFDGIGEAVPKNGPKELPKSSLVVAVVHGFGVTSAIDKPQLGRLAKDFLQPNSLGVGD